MCYEKEFKIRNAMENDDIEVFVNTLNMIAYKEIKKYSYNLSAQEQQELSKEEIEGLLGRQIKEMNYLLELENETTY